MASTDSGLLLFSVEQDRCAHSNVWYVTSPWRHTVGSGTFLCARQECSFRATRETKLHHGVLAVESRWYFTGVITVTCGTNLDHDDVAFRATLLYGGYGGVKLHCGSLSYWCCQSQGFDHRHRAGSDVGFESAARVIRFQADQSSFSLFKTGVPMCGTILDKGVKACVLTATPGEKLDHGVPTDHHGVYMCLHSAVQYKVGPWCVPVVMVSSAEQVERWSSPSSILHVLLYCPHWGLSW